MGAQDVGGALGGAGGAGGAAASAGGISPGGSGPAAESASVPRLGAASRGPGGPEGASGPPGGTDDLEQDFDDTADEFGDEARSASDAPGQIVAGEGGASAPGASSTSEEVSEEDGLGSAEDGFAQQSDLGRGEGGTSDIGAQASAGNDVVDTDDMEQALAGQEDSSPAATLAKAGAVGVGVSGGAQFMALMALFNYLKLLAAMAQAALSNLLALVLAFISHLVSFVVSGVVAAGAAFASAFGVGVVMGTMLAGGLATALFVGAIGLFSVSSSNAAAQHSDAVRACIESVESKAAAESGDATGATGNELANAKEVYSVLAAWGMSEANIAGILGNWKAESRIDPTSVQSHFTAPYKMTAEKETLATDNNNGIGLGQWTFGRNDNLRKFASSTDSKWWTLTTQLAFMLSPAEGSNADVVRDMISNDIGSAGDAALHFHDKWERSADTPEMAKRRADYAEAWLPYLSAWEIDNELADSVLNQAGSTLDDANVNQVERAKTNCRSLDTVDVALSDGGMAPEAAQALVDLYNEEGDAFLDGRYGQYGGPGSCGTDHAMNCVSFSTYFLNKYTTFQTYPGGNGIATAPNTARQLGRKLITTPVAYSVGSGPGSGPAGHTLVVLAVEGDKVYVGEAGYCQFRGRVEVRSAAAMKAQGWKFVDVSDLMLPAEDVKTS